MQKLSFLTLFLLLPRFCYADSPFSFELIYDASQIKQSGESNFAGRALATLSYEQSFSLWGGEFTPQISYSAFRGRNGSDIAQDVQGFSNIDAEHFSALQEVNVQWQNEKTLVRLGQLDANANFVSLEHAGQFINASFGLTPTAFVLPTYPDMEYGLYAEQKITESSSLSFGYYRPDEVDDTGEQQPLLMLGYCLVCTDTLTANVGYWRVRHQHIHSISGAYAYVEGKLSTNVNGFMLYSQNNVSANEEIKRHIKTGIVFQPQWHQADQLGLGYSRVIGPTNETAIEAFYLWPIMAQLALQPDIQWLTDSNTTHGNSFISTLRVIVSF